MLLDGHSWKAHQLHFPANATLDITMTLLMRDDRMGSFEGEIRHGARRLASDASIPINPMKQSYSN